MYMYTNYSDVHICTGVILIYTCTFPIPAARPSLTLGYNDVSITL